MTSGPTGAPRANQAKPPADPALPPAEGTAPDPLLTGKQKPRPGADQTPRPRGYRQRRTTLPRSTRGWSRSIVWSLIGLTVFATIYGLIARIDSSIESGGKLRPVGGVTSVTSPFNTLVQQVLVREGQLVKAGQPLVLLRDEAMQQQRRQLLAIQASWRKEVELLAYQLGLPARLPADPAARRQLQVAQLEVRMRTLAALEEAARSAISTRQQINDARGLSRKLNINRQISQRLRGLQSSGAISRLEYDRQRERELEVEMALRRTQLEVESGRRLEKEGLYKARQIPLANLRQLFSTFENARQQLRESESRLVEVEERLALSSLRAPVAGRVFDLSVRRGEMASPARPTLKIVPQGALEAVVDISNKDIGFVRVGMPVEVRVASFPFTDYGSLKGTLVRISLDALPPDATHGQEYFQGTVRLSGSTLSRDGVLYTLRPGMAISGLLQLGPRPVISLLGDRFTRFFDSTRSIR
ncbi:MAG: HlyD family efflux transporter periplasmic adaptor subunit [Synechococcus sp.]|nr:HlyD family efflux transporter periplasmic adaptor subunit [Synechococcus sp.]